MPFCEMSPRRVQERTEVGAERRKRLPIPAPGNAGKKLQEKRAEKILTESTRTERLHRNLLKETLQKKRDKIMTPLQVLVNTSIKLIQ